MTPRPASLTVIAWVLIVFAALGFMAMALMSMLMSDPLMQQRLASSPLPPFAVLTVGCLVGLQGGIGCLNRWGWARYVYVVWSAASLAFNLATTPYTKPLLIPGVALCSIVIVIMFLPKSQAWFARHTAV